MYFCFICFSFVAIVCMLFYLLWFLLNGFRLQLGKQMVMALEDLYLSLKGFMIIIDRKCHGMIHDSNIFSIQTQQPLVSFLASSDYFLRFMVLVLTWSTASVLFSYFLSACWSFLVSRLAVQFTRSYFLWSSFAFMILLAITYEIETIGVVVAVLPRCWPLAIWILSLFKYIYI